MSKPKPDWVLALESTLLWCIALVFMLLSIAMCAKGGI